MLLEEGAKARLEGIIADDAAKARTPADEIFMVAKKYRMYKKRARG